MLVSVEKVVALCISQDGDEYVFGAEASVSDTNPDAFDCSELIQWSCGRAGVEPVMPDGSWIQARHCKNYDTLITVEEAIETRGALLFKFSDDPFVGARPSSSHVAMSLGNGLTIEARSSYYGVGMFTAIDRGWTHAALIPGAIYAGEYMGVLHVPDYDWARGVIRDGLNSGLINVDDNYPEDWEDDKIIMGRLWTLFSRNNAYLERLING